MNVLTVFSGSGVSDPAAVGVQIPVIVLSTLPWVAFVFLLLHAGAAAFSDSTIRGFGVGVAFACFGGAVSLWVLAALSEEGARKAGDPRSEWFVCGVVLLPVVALSAVRYLRRSRDALGMFQVKRGPVAGMIVSILTLCPFVLYLGGATESGKAFKESVAVLSWIHPVAEVGWVVFFFLVCGVMFRVANPVGKSFAAIGLVGFVFVAVNVLAKLGGLTVPVVSLSDRGSVTVGVVSACVVTFGCFFLRVTVRPVTKRLSKNVGGDFFPVQVPAGLPKVGVSIAESVGVGAVASAPVAVLPNGEGSGWGDVPNAVVVNNLTPKGSGTVFEVKFDGGDSETNTVSPAAVGDGFSELVWGDATLAEVVTPTFSDMSGTPSWGDPNSEQNINTDTGLTFGVGSPPVDSFAEPYRFEVNNSSGNTFGASGESFAGDSLNDLGSNFGNVEEATSGYTETVVNDVEQRGEGWFPDETDPTLFHWWDGTQWSGDTARSES
jgi:hypothetical protein